MVRPLSRPVVLGAAAVAVCLLLLARESAAQQQSAMRAQAQSDFLGRRYNEAADAYGEIVKSDPDDAQAWFRLGFSQHNLRQYKDAIVAYDEAADRSFAPSTSLYNKACAELLLGRERDGMATLREAIDAGFTNADLFRNDTDLSRIRGTAEFDELQKMVSDPVGRLPSGRDLDVLVGTWGLWQDGNLVGRVEYTFANQGFSLNEKTVIGIDVVSLVMYYYSKTDEAWLVAGVAEDGSVFDGTVSSASYTVELSGSKKDDVGLIDVRKRINTTGASRASLVVEERQPDGTWAVLERYEMRKSTLAPE